jgi:hypothetical protein
MECYIAMMVPPQIYYKDGMLQVIIVEYQLLDSLCVVVFYYNVIESPRVGIR